MDDTSHATGSELERRPPSLNTGHRPHPPRTGSARRAGPPGALSDATRKASSIGGGEGKTDKMRKEAKVVFGGPGGKRPKGVPRESPPSFVQPFRFPASRAPALTPEKRGKGGGKEGRKKQGRKQKQTRCRHLVPHHRPLGKRKQEPDAPPPKASLPRHVPTARPCHHRSPRLNSPTEREKIPTRGRVPPRSSSVRVPAAAAAAGLCPRPAGKPNEPPREAPQTAAQCTPLSTAEPLA